MEPKKASIWKAVELFESGMSVAERAWRLAAFLLIGSSGALSALIAKSDPIFRNLGAIYWIGVGLLTALAVALLLFLVKAANYKQAAADLNRALATPRSTINPMLDSFKDVIISPEDMRLPNSQIHERKHFRNCKFAGPGVFGFNGGSFNDNAFVHCGDFVALPRDAELTGVVVLRNCTFEGCEFVSMTLLCDQATARSFLNSGASVKGLIS